MIWNTNLPDEDAPGGSVEAGHLDAVAAHVGPVDVVRHPVHRHALRVLESKLHHHLARARPLQSSATQLLVDDVVLVRFDCWTAQRRAALRTKGAHYLEIGAVHEGARDGLDADVGPVDAVVGDVEVEGASLAHARYGNDDVLADETRFFSECLLRLGRHPFQTRERVRTLWLASRLMRRMSSLRVKSRKASGMTQLISSAVSS